MAGRSLLAGLCCWAAFGLSAQAGERLPEQLLPPTTQVYLRWDGIEAHVEAYQRSALGQIFTGELGRTLRAVRARAERRFKLESVGEKLLAGAPPKELQQSHEELLARLGLPEAFARTGIVLGFEARALPPRKTLLRNLVRVGRGEAELQDLITPQMQLTLIFPGAADQVAIANYLGALAKEKTTRAIRIHQRDCYLLDEQGEEWRWVWWLEGKHLVVVGSTERPEVVVARVGRAGRGITDQPLYRQLQKPDFEVTSRGFLAGKSLAANLRLLLLSQPDQLAWLDDLGLFEIEAVRFWEGFEGVASRSVVEVEVSGSRKGITRFMVPRAVDLKCLPPLPADAHRWTVARTDPSAAYELLLGYLVVENGLSPEGSVNPSRAFAEARETMRREIDDALGIKIADLFATLGDTFLTYYSPSDGLPGLAQVIAVSVKDEHKVERAFDGFGRKLADLTEGELQFRTRPYHGASLREFVFPGEGSPVTVTYTVCQGWLVIALNPQPVQGFVLRCQGKLPAWKADPATARALARVPADAGLVQVVDPRPSMNLLLGAAPVLSGLVGSEFLLTAGDLPHPGAVTRHLFPNVAWTSFDGKTFRKDSRDSLALPFQEVGLEWLPFVFGSDFLFLRR
jgi:hypothetical protein